MLRRTPFRQITNTRRTLKENINTEVKNVRAKTKKMDV